VFANPHRTDRAAGLRHDPGERLASPRKLFGSELLDLPCKSPADGAAAR